MIDRDSEELRSKLKAIDKEARRRIENLGSRIEAEDKANQKANQKEIDRLDEQAFHRPTKLDTFEDTNAMMDAFKE